MRRWRIPIELPAPVVGKASRLDLQALCVLGAVNRDPDEFGDTAQKFNITRSPNNHVSFGAGVHFCLGANLARMEAQIAFEHFARRVGHFRLAAEPSYRENFVLRGLSRLPITFGTNT